MARDPCVRGKGSPYPHRGTRGAKLPFLHRRRKHPHSSVLGGAPNSSQRGPRSSCQHMQDSPTPARVTRAPPSFLPTLQGASSPCARGAPRRRRHEPLFLGARISALSCAPVARREPPLLECVRPPGRAVKTPVAACAARHESPGLPAHVQGQPFSGNARHEHPATPSLLAWRSTSTPVPASEARAPAGNFPARGDHPSSQHARRKRPLPDTRRCPNPASGRVVQGPFVALLEPPGSGVLPLTRRVPQSKAMFPQLPRRGSTLVGSPASTGHGAVPYRGPCGPHSQAARPQLGTEGSQACDTSS